METPELRFEKIDDYRWELPRQGAMRVPGRVYASEKMLSKLERERVASQVANVATFPGIVGYSLAMPDAHWGYGFCVGGVAAMDVDAGGVISPGGVGFDISCLPWDARVLHEHGCTRAISEMLPDWEQSRVVAQDFGALQPVAAKPFRFFRKRPDTPLYRLSTSTGRTIAATGDHPFYTPDGMVRLDQIRRGDRLALYNFQGVPYERPSDEVILSESRMRAVLAGLGKGSAGNAATQILNQLRARGLLPLHYGSPAVPYLLKLIGFVTGDGTLGFFPSGRCGIGFYGRPEDLEDIRKDVSSVGYAATQIYSRQRTHQIQTFYSKYSFQSLENSCRTSPRSLAALLAALGCPVGNKADQSFRVPPWIRKAPLWQKRLYLAAYCGAEMDTPSTSSGLNFYCPTVCVSKEISLMDSAAEFLQDISAMLEEFGVETRTIARMTDYYSGKGGRKSGRCRLVLANRYQNLSALYEKVGFVYNRRKLAQGLQAVHYLRLKAIKVSRREAIAAEAQRLHAHAGVGAKTIHKSLGSPEDISLRFIERSIYEGRKSSARIGDGFDAFSERRREFTEGLGASGMVWDAVDQIEKISAPEWVYDFTVSHPSHNFVADGFVVSNCGVRLLRSGLMADEAAPRMDLLMDALFHQVPSGVGSKGKLRLTEAQMRKVFEKGARWAVENGLGDAEDLDTLEDRGAIEDADPDGPSRRAVERGRDQLGTLGSGNHFLEVQKIDAIYDESVAEAFGLFEGQLVVLIHTGSRGCGYQICSDSIQEMLRASLKYGIALPDKQLCCAPLKSPEGRAYFGAMGAGANFARANRQVITHRVREAFMHALGASPRELDMGVVYDVCHNVAKIEKHEFAGRKLTLCVHRKGATRSFPAGHPELPPRYQKAGQPVFLPGSMGTASYVLVGTERAMRETFGTVAHGAGRRLSRTQASKQISGRDLRLQLEKQGIRVRTDSERGLAEEAPFAYKDVSEVVEICDRSGIAKKVARMRPMGVVKG
ncbi:MAG: hypothetical protein A3G41_06105 [Elusimicrobia bacterium RIFCSPLOWO2_12_FULL_59_9]|nr:MAG: hypothetical protein A3G41_06105 [Elusimicrobia bacterium RIFCSPLOWO2_12_FULL_59_9]